jgi:hypothetical protein
MINSTKKAKMNNYSMKACFLKNADPKDSKSLLFSLLQESTLEKQQHPSQCKAS